MQENPVKLQRKRIFRILFLLYCTALFLLAILPINGESSPISDTYIVTIRLDYLLHTLIFLPFLPLAMHSLSGTSQRKRIIKKILSLIIIGLLFAIITESIQFYLPYRSFNINDLIANTLGVILGFPIILVLKRQTLSTLNSKSEIRSIHNHHKK